MIVLKIRLCYDSIYSAIIARWNTKCCVIVYTSQCLQVMEREFIMMKNKSNWKKVILTVLLAAMGIQAAGCGGSKTDNTTAQKEFVYVPEYRSLDAQDGVDQVFINEDTIYYRSGSYNEAAQSYEEYLVMLKVGEDESQKIPLDFGEDSSIQQIAMDRDGSFLAVLSRYVYDEEIGRAHV